MARRLLSIWLPKLASDTSLRTRPLEEPFALTHRSGNADHLHCLNTATSAKGLHRGMALADARAIWPDLATRPADIVREAAALASLRRWAGRYAPMVATDGVDGLMADISGVPHLFGGESDLRDDLQARLARAGLHAASAIAGTRGAAHALARHGGGIDADGRLATGIGHLPVTALRVDHDAAEALARVRLAALFAKGADEIDSGFGIDGLRLSAPVTEALAPEQIGGQIGGGATIRHEYALADLLSSIGNRIGFDRVLRLLPATSLIPERSFLLAPAAWSTPEPIPHRAGSKRPITLFPPEPVTAASGTPTASFRWRRMRFTTLRATGPERITPEWWFDDPAWRSGLRDYWRIETREGPRLWLFNTPQAEGWTGPQARQNWYAQGEFA